jgi:hypothetical protein
MPKTSLTDMQRVILSGAAMRLDHRVLPVPKSIQNDAKAIPLRHQTDAGQRSSTLCCSAFSFLSRTHSAIEAIGGYYLCPKGYLRGGSRLQEWVEGTKGARPTYQDSRLVSRAPLENQAVGR